MVKECNHSLLKIYFRKKKKDDENQAWNTIDNTYYCDKCKEIIKVK